MVVVSFFVFEVVCEGVDRSRVCAVIVYVVNAYLSPVAC